MSAVTQARTRAVHTAVASWEDFRVQLEALRTDCLQQREQALTAVAQDGTDSVAWTRSSSLERTVQEIEAALSRIEAGTYGACVGCGFAIPAERLELRPFASTCVSCTGAR